MTRRYAIRQKILGKSKEQSPQQPLVRTSPRVLESRIATGGRLLRRLPLLALKIDPSVYSQLAHDHRIPHGAFRLWHLLRDYANKQGEAWPSIRTLTQSLSCDYRTFKSWLSTLERWGYVDVAHGRGKHSNRYNFKKFLAQPMSVGQQTNVIVMSGNDQTQCLVSTSPKLSQQANPRKGDGKESPPKLSNAQLIVLDHERKLIVNRLKELEGDLISEKLTQERKELRERLPKVQAALRIPL